MCVSAQRGWLWGTGVLFAELWAPVPTVFPRRLVRTSRGLWDELCHGAGSVLALSSTGDGLHVDFLLQSGWRLRRLTSKLLGSLQN